MRKDHNMDIESNASSKAALFRCLRRRMASMVCIFIKNCELLTSLLSETPCSVFTLRKLLDEAAVKKNMARCLVLNVFTKNQPAPPE